MLKQLNRLLQFRLLYIETDKLVNFFGFYFVDKHPLTLALKQGISALKDFYQKYRSDKIVFPAYFSKDWKSIRQWYIPPWGGGSLAYADNKGYSIGPHTDEEVEKIMERIKSVCNNIKEHGYKPFLHPNALIRVCILKKGRSRVYLVTHGQHRASALCTLGYKRILVELQPYGKEWPFNMPRIIDIKDVEKWPNVANKLYDKKDAIRFFETYFSRNNWEKLGL